MNQKTLDEAKRIEKEISDLKSHAKAFEELSKRDTNHIRLSTRDDWTGVAFNTKYMPVEHNMFIMLYLHSVNTAITILEKELESL